VILQVTVAAMMVVGGLPRVLQAVHVAVGVAVWGVVVIVALQRSGRNMSARPAASREADVDERAANSAARDTR